jgi:hypothetical protein
MYSLYYECIIVFCMTLSHLDDPATGNDALGALKVNRTPIMA